MAKEFLTESEVRARLALGDPNEIGEWWAELLGHSAYQRTACAVGDTLHWWRLLTRLGRSKSRPQCPALHGEWWLLFGKYRPVWAPLAVAMAPTAIDVPLVLSDSKICPDCLRWRVLYARGELTLVDKRRLDAANWKEWAAEYMPVEG